MLNNTVKKDLLRIVFAGSVDDGKSTLLGRLFFDSDQIYEDQLEALKRSSQNFADGDIDLSLFTDGLSAEREQKITIDVAYRYFNLGNRRLIIADVPGHEQYTRNMVTGASNANVALILIDSRKGLLPQTKRHLFIASLLGIPHILVVVNKMDLENYSREKFESIKKDFIDFAAKLQIVDLQFIPVSSLRGDMVVSRGDNLNWYQGPTVYHYFENLEMTGDLNLIDFRLPVQNVIRPNQDLRVYAGKIESGIIKEGESLSVYPSGKIANVKKIWVAGKPEVKGFALESVMVALDRELDISRGDMLARPKNPPEVGNLLDATICWMSDTPLNTEKKYLIKQTCKTTSCNIEQVLHQIDINTLHRIDSASLSGNEIGKVRIHTQEPLCFDVYQKNRNTGSFIIIDPVSMNTIAAGMIIRKTAAQVPPKSGNNTIYVPDILSEQKFRANKEGAVIWFTGLSGSGKTTLAEALQKRLRFMNIDCEHLDGDMMRECLSKDLGFSKHDRDINIERAAYIARLLAAHGVVVLASFISPYSKHRELARREVANFIEIYVDTPLPVCEERDVKGLYKKARLGEITDFTGINDPYEVPKSPEITISTAASTPDVAVGIIMDYLRNQGLI